MRRVDASFRDNNGWIYEKDNMIYRRVNSCYEENYQLLMTSGLYQQLIEKGLLVKHEEIEINDAYRDIKPEKIPFISYPYEWSFDQYKDAALLTLEISKLALQYNMILKDASAYNIQFIGYRPIFIDTLSFEKYQEGQLWDAYGQFCRHFLAPLILMSMVDIRLSSLMKQYIDGIPLDLAVGLLPKRKKMNLSLYIHLFLHAKEQEKHENDRDVEAKQRKMPKQNIISIMDNLIHTISKLTLKQEKSTWSNYYEIHNYNKEAFSEKHKIVAEYLKCSNAHSVCDLGANQGEFSKLAAEQGAEVVACDIDVLAVNNHYNFLKQDNTEHILPLIFDITNPSPAIGWANKERETIQKRSRWDCVMALALIHHLAIGNNVPFEKIAQYLSGLSQYLIIEFVPKEDSQVAKMLSTRKDIFSEYNEDMFEEQFSQYYDIVDKKEIQGSNRKIFLMKKKEI